MQFEPSNFKPQKRNQWLVQIVTYPPSAWPVSRNPSNSSRCLVAESHVSTANRGTWMYRDPLWEPRGGGDEEEEVSQQSA